MVLESCGAGLDMHKFQEFLHQILNNSVDLYRYKGVLAVSDKGRTGKTLMYILQGVHDMPEVTFSSEWPSEKPVKTQIVMIGRKLDREAYRKEFLACFPS